MTIRRVYPAGRAFLENEEGLRLDVYPDQVDVMTIGRGHRITDADRHSGRFANGITLDQANALFDADLLERERMIAAHITVPLTDCQHAALASLLFNEGINPIATWDPSQGTLGRLLSAGDYDGAAKQFLVWNKAWDKRLGRYVVLPILVARRAREVRLWCSDEATADTEPDVDPGPGDDG